MRNVFLLFLSDLGLGLQSLNEYIPTFFKDREMFDRAIGIEFLFNAGLGRPGIRFIEYDVE